MVFGEGIVGLAVGIILARILEPEEFGLVAMVNIFVGFTAVFINAGTGSSIIQKPEVTKEDLSTIFLFNIMGGLTLSVVLYSSANLLSEFYGRIEIIKIVQLLAWKPLIASLAIVPQFLMIRQINLKSRTIAQFCGQISAGIIGIYMALSGYGVFALVAASLSSSIISTILYWLQSSWRPSLIFKMSSFRIIWNFSGKILLGNILHQLVHKADELIVGSYLSAGALGIYNRGKNLSVIPTRMVGQILSRSFYPIFSRLQSEKRIIRFFYQRQSQFISWISAPIYLILFVVADDLIEFLLGNKWLPSVPFFRLALIADYLYSNNVLKQYLINSLGRPDLNLKRSLVVGPARILLYLVPLIFIGQVLPEYLLFATILSYISSFLWLNIDIRNLLLLKMKTQIAPMVKYLIIGIISTIPLVFIGGYINIPWVALLITGFLFILSNLTLLIITNDEITKKYIRWGRQFI